MSQRSRLYRIDIADADVVPLSEFPLGWRFAEARHGHQPPETLRRIRPLSPAAAATVAASLADVCRDGSSEAVTFRSDDAPGEVRRRLRALPPAAGEAVLVSWDAQTAALTDWDVFVNQWDDFCYSAADDVTVCPLHGAWALRYYRYDVFQFRPCDGAG